MTDTQKNAAVEVVADAIEEVTERWDKLDAGSPAAQGCANKLACLVASNGSIVLAASRASLRALTATSEGSAS